MYYNLVVTPGYTCADVLCVLILLLLPPDTLMSLCLVMMVPYNELNADASFATAFAQVGLPWGQYLVALGAVLG
jgi:hypothetical protein